MSELYKGWREDFGIFFLTLALVFMGLWVASHYPSHGCWHIKLGDSGTAIGSYYGYFGWYDLKEEINPAPEHPSETAEHSTNTQAIGITTHNIKLSCSMAIPYWAIVTPLTLLSLWLLLSKPRPSTLEKISEPAQ